MKKITTKINEGISNNYTFILFDEIKEELINKLKTLNKSLTIISFVDIDWYKDFSPYPYDKFAGEGISTIEEVKQYLKENNIDDYYVIGYSLGGLLALYSINKLNGKGYGSISGSLWYPDFDNYISKEIIKEKNIYISLGDKESNSKNQLMKTVEDKTKLIVDLLKENNEVYFQMNQGGHFNNVEERLLMAVKYFVK